MNAIKLTACCCALGCNAQCASASSFRKNAKTNTTRCVCRDTQCAGADVQSKNATFTTRRGCRINREGRTGICRFNAMITSTTRRITRCCDA